MTETNQGDAPLQQEPASKNASLARIKSFLKAKDDTQRFVGLALLKAELDNSQQLQQDEQVVSDLWACISPTFVDRLLRTGSKASGENSKEMLDLAVSVLHTFAALLSESSKSQPRFTDRIPGLVGAVLYSSDQTVGPLLELLHTLVSTPEGANAFMGVEDVSPLTEAAPSHSEVLDIFRFAWLNVMPDAKDITALSGRIDSVIQNLVTSFTGTDAVTLLEFLGSFLRQTDAEALQLNPKWLKSVVNHIKTLVTSRPNTAARSAYTNASASLLQTYPNSTPQLLFVEDKKDEKPFAYLLVNLMLIDIRSSAPTLLEQLNTPSYLGTSRRLASAFDVISTFIGALVRSLDDESDGLIMSPDSLLKLRKSISETMSVATEYLRDRWDASFAGAMGLHPDARTAEADTATGKHRTLAWDDVANAAEEDPLILSAVRALSLWLREDENETLRQEAIGLMDMFMELYQTRVLDFRTATLVALEGLFTLPEGRGQFLENSGWDILVKDLTSIIQDGDTDREASRGVEISLALRTLVDESVSTAEEWMNVVTTVAAWDISGDDTLAWQDFRVSTLQLCLALLQNASTGLKRRYTHSVGAIRGLAAQIQSSRYEQEVEDVKQALNRMQL